MKFFNILISSALIYMPVLLQAQSTATLLSGEIVHITFAQPYCLKFKEDPSFVVKEDVKDRKGNVLIKAGTPAKFKGKAKREEKGFMLEIDFASTTAVDGTYIELWGTYRAERRTDKKKKPGFDNREDISGIKVVRDYTISLR